MDRIEDIDFTEIGSKEARELGPFSPADTGCTVRCYGETERWRSREAAIEFYKTACMFCGGSELDRYWRIVSELSAGSTDASDSPR